MKYIGVVEYPDQTDEIIHEAFRQALTRRAGTDVCRTAARCDAGEVRSAAGPRRPIAIAWCVSGSGRLSVAEAVGAARAAKNPILLLGQGVFVGRPHEAA